MFLVQSESFYSSVKRGYGKPEERDAGFETVKTENEEDDEYNVIYFC